jgi:hypothetical protein
MEREQQLTKLVNVLRRTARSVRGETSADVVEQAIGQYNRVLSALSDLDNELEALFVPLADGSDPGVVASSCRQLAAYYRDEVSQPDNPFDSESFKGFWKSSAQDLEDVGDFIRDSIARMQEKKSTEQNRNGEG